MRKSFLTLLAALFLLSGEFACMHRHDHDHDHHHHSRGMHPTMYATLYQQRAAEYQALCYQAFNLASLQLQNELKAGHSKPLAVVVDIDETVLDNSPYQAAGIAGGFGYPVRWNEWIEAAAAETVPGSLEFLLEAKNAGVEVFYITNRKEEYREATLRNLRKKGFPFADDVHLLMRTDQPEKEVRRNYVKERFEIAVFAGDNLGDFSGIFETNDMEDRMQQTIENRNDFGKRWIVLPNAVYGNWVDVLPGYQRGLSTEVLADSLLKGLKGF
ncbi:MAG: 5'-nucleotidase, lipoprotein e(P4) family [Bacteroidales bacterium]|nr:5'-nucleotidase, lipoprotein e(P4) family [Bacteroidales bacterium]